MVNICPGVIFLPVFHKDESLAPFLFLIYINDLSDGLQCNPKLFADGTSLFETVQSIKKATNDLNNDLTKITKWAFQSEL